MLDTIVDPNRTLTFLRFLNRYPQVKIKENKTKRKNE